MRIALVTPAGPGTRNGNRHTALRWAAFLRNAGHRVEVSVEWSGVAADAMLALHARRSHASIRAFPREKPLVLALTGTDVYRDIHDSADARESLQLAERLVRPMTFAKGNERCELYEDHSIRCKRIGIRAQGCCRCAG